MKTQAFDPTDFRPWKNLDGDLQRILEFVLRRWRESPERSLSPEPLQIGARVGAESVQRAHRYGLISPAPSIRPTLLGLLYCDEALPDLLTLDRLLRLAHETVGKEEVIPWSRLQDFVDLKGIERLRSISASWMSFDLVGLPESIELRPRADAVQIDSLRTLLAHQDFYSSRMTRHSLPSLPTPFRLRLTRVRSTNFRAHRSLDLPLGPLTVLVGPNGSGKSTLLRLLDFFSESAREGVASALTRAGRFERILSRESAGPLSLGLDMRLDYGDGRPLDASLSFDIAPFAGQWAVEREVLKAGSQTLIEGVRGRALVGGRDVFHAPQTSALETLTQESIHPLPVQLRRALGQVKLIARDRQNDELVPRIAEDEDLTRALSESLSALLPRIEGVKRQVVPASGERSSGPSKCVLTLVEKGGVELELDEISEGTWQMLQLSALHVLDEAPTAILLEEPDASLHPSAQPALRDLLRSLATRSTVIVTSHSPSFVSLLDAEKEVVALGVEGAQALPLSEAIRSSSWLKSFDASGAFIRLGSERSS